MKKGKYEDGIPLSEALQHYFEALGMDDKMVETGVLSKWKEIIGDSVAVRTKEIYIKDKTLYLSINSSVVREELVQKKSEIINKLNACAGRTIVNKIYLK
ncbi:DUF721 domain-containing protein [Crocinitomicaceae bacterium]|nr:DUF721 domain-containing protein [Crocinitomicaceae bacterium]